MSRISLVAVVVITTSLPTYGYAAGAGLKLDATFIVAGQGADLGATILALNRCPGCRESNPWLSDPTKLAIGKVVVSAAAVYACRELRKSGHKKEARIIAIILGGVGAGMAVSNMRKGR